MHIYGFEKLDVWNLSRSFTMEIYTLTRHFPKEEMFGLTNQMRRAVVSISSNLAEGSTRHTSKELSRYTQISYGSSLELLSQLILAKDLEYISEEDYFRLRNRIEEITMKLNSLYQSQLRGR